MTVTNPKLQIPNPNHAQPPNPKAATIGGLVWDLGVGFGIWQLGVVGAWDLELGI